MIDEFIKEGLNITTEYNPLAKAVVVGFDPEFTGEKAYEKATVTTQGKECTALKDLQNVMIESNYPIAFISAILVDKNGNESELDKILFHGANGDGLQALTTSASGKHCIH